MNENMEAIIKHLRVNGSQVLVPHRAAGRRA